MNKRICIALTAACAVALLTANAWARGGGGGHGGGHGGGGHHAGGHGHAGGHHAGHNGHHAGNHHGDHHNGFNHHAHIPAHFHHGNAPFTHGWWGNHPNGWNHGWNNGGWGGWGGWGPANWGSTAAWLGLAAAAPLAYGYGGGSPTYVNGTIVDDDYASDDDNTSASDPNSVPAALTGDTNQGQVGGNAESASQLAQSGAGAEPEAADFLPLGVFSLAPYSQPEASAMLHLAVAKNGLLRGTYVDLTTDQEQAVQGAVDKTTQRVAWTIGKGKVVFETALADLTQDKVGSVALYFENGQTREWKLARYEQQDEAEDTEGAEGEEPAAEGEATPAEGN